MDAAHMAGVFLFWKKDKMHTASSILLRVLHSDWAIDSMIWRVGRRDKGSISQRLLYIEL